MHVLQVARAVYEDDGGAAFALDRRFVESAVDYRAVARAERYDRRVSPVVCEELGDGRSRHLFDFGRLSVRRLRVGRGAVRLNVKLGRAVAVGAHDGKRPLVG